jgi:hypothetical protein
VWVVPKQQNYYLTNKLKAIQIFVKFSIFYLNVNVIACNIGKEADTHANNNFRCLDFEIVNLRLCVLIDLSNTIKGENNGVGEVSFLEFFWTTAQVCKRPDDVASCLVTSSAQVIQLKKGDGNGAKILTEY